MLFNPVFSELGLCQLPIRNDGSKAPALIEWEQLQRRLPYETELAEWNRSSKNLFRGFICGDVSENLEVIDIDIPDLVPLFIERVDASIPGLTSQLVQVKTGRGGAHFYYRCEDKPQGNQKLAKVMNGNGKYKTAIETRGEGGYVVAPPSTGYEFISGDWDQLTILDANTRDALLNIARSFSDIEPDDDKPTRVFSPPAVSGDSTHLRPGDDFNQRMSWDDILIPAGWVKKWQSSKDDRAGWQRPGKEGERGISATTGYNGHDIFYVFSSNAEPFQAETGHSKFTVYTILHHGGDYALSARALAVRGFGDAVADDTNPWIKYGTYINSDLANARRFVTQHSDVARYIPDHGWRIYNGKQWRADDIYAEVIAKETAVSIRSELNGLDSDVFQAMTKWAQQSVSARKLKDMLTLAKSEPTLRASLTDFDRDPLILNCANGVIDLRTGQLREHSRDDYCTRMVPIDYDPDADSSEWESFINTIMLNDRDMVNYLQDALGYSITGSAACNAFFFCYGEGHNGKTTIIESVRRVLGDYAENLHKSTLMHKPADDSKLPGVAKLPGTRFVSASEVSEGDKLDEAIIKTLTGSDAITARMLHKNEITFTPTHHIWGMGNHQPKISGNDEGIWRRVHLIPFTHHFAMPDVRIRDAFYNDPAVKRGILAWLVRGAAHWYQNGMTLTRPPKVAQATQDYREEMDVLGTFINEMCFVDKATPEVFVKASELYSAYRTWATNGGYYPYTMSSFGIQLRRRGFEKRRSGANGHARILGITLA
jgi:putative DNA primase/helicase